MSDIGDRIIKARKERGINQADLARAVGISKQALSQIEKGTTKSPKPAHLFKIADALQYKARYLATGEGPKTTEEAITLSFRKAS